MEFIYGFVLILFFSAALLFSTKQANARDNKAGWLIDRPKKSSPKEHKMFLKRSELEKRLVSLSESKPPKNLSMGAMCYDMCMPTGTLDLICTHCKQKNVHENTFTIGRVLECERMVQAIRKAKEGIDAKLDNRAYCSKCSKDKKEVTKSLFLEVKYSGSEKTHRTEIDFDSLQAVLAFVQGKDRIANDTGQETALRDKVKIIRTALGLEEKGE